MFGKRGESGVPIREGKDLVPFLTKEFGDHLDHGQIVIDEYYFRHLPLS